MEITKIFQWNSDEIKNIRGDVRKGYKAKRTKPRSVDTKRDNKRHLKRCIINKKKNVFISKNDKKPEILAKQKKQ